jgi:hypothetical protein
MNIDSKTLLLFLEKNIENKYISIPKTHLSKFSISLIKDIFRHMIFAEKSYTAIPGQWIHTDSFPKGYDFDYCHDIIKTEIDNMKKTTCIYSFVIKNHSFQIAFVSPENKTLCEKKFKHYIKRIYIWLYLATIYSPPICSQKLNIYIYLTSLKKFSPTNREHFSQIHANTAFTTSCKKNTEIHIYRNEEWFKVLIHECFHCFGLDFSSEIQDKINKQVESIFPINSKMNLFEVYCEMFAEIINVMFVSQHIIKKIENLDEYIHKLISKTQQLLEKERLFSLFQFIKVLNCYGIKYQDLYEKNPISIQKRKNYRENDTNIFSYYILKCFFMFYYDDFLSWCFLHNQGSIAFHKKNMDEFAIFIKQHYNRPEFIIEIENMEKAVNELSNTGFIFKNMRMSLFELE